MTISQHYIKIIKIKSSDTELFPFKKKYIGISLHAKALKQAKAHILKINTLKVVFRVLFLQFLPLKFRKITLKFVPQKILIFDCVFVL